MEDQSIKSLFSIAESKRNSVETAQDTGTATYKENLASSIATYEECRKLADRLSLFSPNESLEDIGSGDLQYLLINYHLGDLLFRVSGTDRKSQLQKARLAYERYLNLLSHYEILSPSDKKLYAAYSENPTTFSTISTTNAEARRAVKIKNFQEEKALKTKLNYLARNPSYLDQDDATVRELQLTNLSLCTHTTFQNLESLNREVEILALAPPPTAPSPSPSALSHDHRSRNGQHDNYSDRLDRPIAEILASGNNGPILDQGGKPLRPFTLLDGRQRVQAGVFRSGHNLPTMTIDEYLEEERKRGGIIEGGGEASGRVAEVDEDDLERADEETMKAREWDEFVEANPKGSGNTLNRG